MKKLLITGASGFLGWNICASAQSSWNVFGTVFSHNVTIPGCTIFTINLTDYKETKKILFDIRPDAVIHTAAASQPNYCQENPENSYLINVETSINLAGFCTDLQVPYIFTSTDLVFDGKNPPYSELSPVSPVSAYGEQKVEAENGILLRYPEAAVCRMPLMFGDPSPVSESFLQPILSSLQNNIKLSLFIDEYRTPIGGYSAAQGLLMVLDAFHGIIHLGGKERVSRHEFGMKVAEYCSFDKSLIMPLLQKDITMPAPRPADVSLDSSLAYDRGYSPLNLIDEFKQLRCLKQFEKL
jgi:dTDP-4-dehydrorhamnose reductase